MKYEKLNIDWNADPNAPEIIILIENEKIILKFFLNCFIYNEFKEGDIGKLTFLNCFKYSYNFNNDEDYFSGRYIYNNSELPWGEFYKLYTDINDFPKESIALNESISKEDLSHYIFFFRDSTFECLAKGFQFEVEKNNRG